MVLIYRVIGVVALAAATSIACAQSPTATSRLRASAEQMAKALVKRDYESVAARTHPRIIEKMGGKALFVEISKIAFSTIPPFTDIRIGEPGPIVKLKQGVAAVVPYVMKMKIPEGTIVTEAIYVAWSPDHGVSWFFADSNVVYKPGGLDFLFPGYHDELALPKQIPPILVKDEGA